MHISNGDDLLCICFHNAIVFLLCGTSVYVTGFWKTNQIITLGLFHFIGPNNGYTRTLHIHSASIRLG